MNLDSGPVNSSCNCQSHQWHKAWTVIHHYCKPVTKNEQRHWSIYRRWSGGQTVPVTMVTKLWLAETQAINKDDQPLFDRLAANATADPSYELYQLHERLKYNTTLTSSDDITCCVTVIKLHTEKYYSSGNNTLSSFHSPNTDLLCIISEIRCFSMLTKRTGYIFSCWTSLASKFSPSDSHPSITTRKTNKMQYEQQSHTRIRFL